MAGTFPTSPGFTATRPRSIQPTLMSDAQSGITQTRLFGGHRWEFTCQFAEMTKDEFMPIYAFALSQKGASGTFKIALPEFATPRGIATGSPVVDGADQTGNTLVVAGFTASQTGIMKQGDIFTIAGQNKVYMLTVDADSNGAGETTLTFEPNLTGAPSDTAALTITDVEFNMRFKNDVQEYACHSPLQFDYEIDLKEAL